jgi:hypothetical protein
VYVDESGVNACLVREYARAPRGETVEGITRGNHFERVNVVGALCNGVHYAVDCYHQSADGEFFEGWFTGCLREAIPKGHTVIMDNAPSTFPPGRSVYDIPKKTTSRMAGIEPALSPVLWGYLRQLGRYSRAFPSPFAVQRAVHHILKTFAPLGREDLNLRHCGLCAISHRFFTPASPKEP